MSHLISSKPASLPLNSTPPTKLLRHEAIYWRTNMHLFITGLNVM